MNQGGGHSKDKMNKILRYSQEKICKLILEGSGQLTIDEVKMAYLLRALDISVKNNYLAELYI